MRDSRILVGQTGFVGGHLDRSGRYDRGFNSRTIQDLAGLQAEELVICSIPSVKWRANQDPEGDWAAISAQLQIFETVRARRCVLISTIDVYPDPAAGSDESDPLTDPHPQAYGRHRRAVELWVAERFADHCILRLPALFGAGLKKNALYDLLHDNLVDRINPAGRFQWYGLQHLVRDLDRATAAELRLVNLFPEPLGMQQILERCFPQAVTAAPSQPAPAYDSRTRHAALFGGAGGYVASAGQVLQEIESFVVLQRKGL